MPTATGISILVHIAIVLVLSSSILSSTPTYQSREISVVLTSSNRAPSKVEHTSSEKKTARIGDEQQRLRPSAFTTFNIMEALAVSESESFDIATEVEKLRGEIAQAQESRQNTRLGSVASRRALDAEYLRRWVRRVEIFGNAALANVGSARGDVRLLVVVNQMGILLDVELLASSGFPHLDRAAIKSVQDAAPYPTFPPALSSQVDKLEIVRTWQFRP